MVEDLPQRGLGDHAELNLSEKGMGKSRTGSGDFQGHRGHRQVWALLSLVAQPGRPPGDASAKGEEAQAVRGQAFGIPWDKFSVVELAGEDRWLKDFESLAPDGHLQTGKGYIVVVATLPVDEKGTLVAKFIKEIGRLQPHVVVWEGPRCAPWESAREGFRNCGLGGVSFKFASTELGSTSRAGGNAWWVHASGCRKRS